MTHDKQRCVEIPETIRSKQPSVKVFYYHINILLADQCLRGINTPLEENQNPTYWPSMRLLREKRKKNPGFVHVILMLEITKPSNNAKKNAQAYLNILKMGNRGYR